MTTPGLEPGPQAPLLASANKLACCHDSCKQEPLHQVVKSQAERRATGRCMQEADDQSAYHATQPFAPVGGELARPSVVTIPIRKDGAPPGLDSLDLNR